MTEVEEVVVVVVDQDMTTLEVEAGMPIKN